MTLTSALRDLAESDYYPFHMPGHKRNLPLLRKYGFLAENPEQTSPYAIDITEIPGFDDLHHAEGLIADAQKSAASLYGAKESIFSVGGSTTALLAGIGAVCQRGDEILVARNCHKSVYHAIELFGLVPSYVWPDVDAAGIAGAIHAEQIEALLMAAAEEKRTIRMLVLTSPTYEGVTSDIHQIAAICHRYDVVLMVDEAHGAHFGLDDPEVPYFPETAVRLGADLVAQSMHKTLPSLTQTAILHRCSERVDGRRLHRMFDLLETSSPSYVLMAGMEHCIRVLQEHRKELMAAYVQHLRGFYYAVRGLKVIRLWAPWERDLSAALDPSKLIFVLPERGAWLCDRLEKDYHLTFEMYAKDYVLGMTSMFDTEEGLMRLAAAITQIDQELQKGSGTGETSAEEPEELDRVQQMTGPKIRRLLPAEAVRCAAEAGSAWIPLDESAGRISADYVYAYPPGIPVVVPGEVIDEDVIRWIRTEAAAGCMLQGGSDGNGISVCSDGQECHGQGQPL